VERPTPRVKKPRLLRLGGIDPGMRRGKGFSIGEIKQAGLSPEEAKALGLPVDQRRKSIWKHNVDQLREFVRKIRRE